MKRRSSRTHPWNGVEAAGNPSLPPAKAQNVAPGLYVIATPIGNARDITLRALDILGECDLIAAEDTRVTAKLFAIYGISKPLTAYNDHNADRERPRLLARLREGARIALVSDAGTPLISDPGYKLVSEAVGQGMHVHAIPGASAVMAALASGALPTDRFFFAGFLPSRSGARQSALAELKAIPSTLVLFESPQRLGASLQNMADVLGSRQAAIGRELTKFHEEVRRGDLAALASHYRSADLPKGEITIVIGPPAEVAPDFVRLDQLLTKALPFMPLRSAVELVAEALGMARNLVYERALAIKAADEDA
jgi:16S rRNA (cytidine1402-2'-O)-methyltransferase